MKYITFVVLLTGLSLGVPAQMLSKKIVDEKVSLIDSLFVCGEETVYVINGIPYKGKDSLLLDSVLQRLNERLLIDFTIIKCTNYPMLHVCKDAVLIQYATQRKRKHIKKQLQELLSAFTASPLHHHIAINSTDPVLYIDNRRIEHTEARAKISQLKAGDIYHIHRQKEPVPATVYGQNAKNGLVRIWTKEYAQSK